MRRFRNQGSLPESKPERAGVLYAKTRTLSREEMIADGIFASDYGNPGDHRAAKCAPPLWKRHVESE
jgi:hypothetical protein